MHAITPLPHKSRTEVYIKTL